MPVFMLLLRLDIRVSQAIIHPGRLAARFAFMRRFAIISDIHSNLDALLAVLEDFEEQGIERIYCLGDLVGYGAYPMEVIDVAMQNFVWVLRGNHDDAVTYKIPKNFNETAAQAVFWTRDRLKPRLYSRPHAFDRWEFVRKKLRDKVRIGEMAFGHGTMDSYFIYIDSVEHAGEAFGAFPPEVKVLFVGHTHIPCVWEKDHKEVLFHKYDAQNLPPMRKNPLIINVGSVGQPRDGDPRACYVIVEGDSFRYRRVDYDVKMAVEAIHCRAGLPDQCGNRLQFGT